MRPTKDPSVSWGNVKYPCRTVRLLGQDYAGRPGWWDEWALT
jgi:hypothetical protein